MISITFQDETQGGIFLFDIPSKGEGQLVDLLSELGISKNNTPLLVCLAFSSGLKSCPREFMPDLSALVQKTEYHYFRIPKEGTA
jgi:hypothetical protein